VKTLLLNKMYRPIAFLSFKKMIRLVMKDKAEVLAEWKDIPLYKGMFYPATIRLHGDNAYVRRKPLVPRFNFKGVFRRDKYRCCYTGIILPPSQLTIDHVIPKAKNGKSSWENCVTCSRKINADKGNRTPEEAGLKLLSKPIIPGDSLSLEYSVISDPHPNWVDYFPGIINNSAEIKEELGEVAS
jgi:hypothetical protein